MTTVQTADQKIDALLAKVAAQRAELTVLDDIRKQPWQTNCSLAVGFTAQPVNIQVAALPLLVGLMAELLVLQDAFPKAASMLGIERVEPTFGGYSVDQWTADLRKRVAVLTYNEKSKKLDDLEAKLKGLMSEDKRRDTALAALEAELD